MSLACERLRCPGNVLGQFILGQVSELFLQFTLNITESEKGERERADVWGKLRGISMSRTSWNQKFEFYAIVSMLFFFSSVCPTNIQTME